MNKMRFVSNFWVFIKLFGCLCHLVDDKRRGGYFCIVNLKIENDENRNTMRKFGGHDEFPEKTGSCAGEDREQSPFKLLSNSFSSSSRRSLKGKY